MFLSMNWIRDFVDLDGIDLDELIHKFTLGTAEVEGYEHKGEDVKEVVVGKILTCEAIPESKKLHKLTVDGGDRIYDVMCGAPNARAGIKVPFVKPGGMAGGMTIEAKPIAGYTSEGMCCSQKEIGVSDDHSGLWELDEDLPVGKNLKEIYEIDDVVFEVDNKSLTNRPDLWGHYGIAREIAALAHRPLREYEVHSLEEYDQLPAVDIKVEDELCYRYSSMVIENITVPKSPVNMQIRLYRCGMRGINLLADLTNYIMLELGQPMHAFDYDVVRNIQVKRMSRPFDFTTLDGKVRHIGTDTLMICSNDEPVAIAGIMGGLDSEIRDTTKSFLMESANFDAASVRKSALSIGMRTDASMRYEKTLDPEMTRTAVGRYLKLLLEIDPGVRVASRFTDCYMKHYPTRVITIDKAYVDRMTGIDIPMETIIHTLRDLAFKVEEKNGELEVTVPSNRATKDVTMKADLIEEISRIYGYDNFEMKTTKVAMHPVAMSPEHVLHRGVKSLLAFEFAGHEVHTYIWNDGRMLAELGLSNKGVLHLTNSVSPDIDTIRMEMVPSLLCVAAKNKGYAPAFTVFEIGSCVPSLNDDKLANEQRHLAVVMVDRKGQEEKLVMKAKEMCQCIARLIKGVSFSYRNAADYEKKEWQHPYNAFIVEHEEKTMGTIAVVHPSVMNRMDKKACAVALELNMDAIYPMLRELPHYSQPSRFPEITSDVSYIVDDSVRYADFERIIADNPSPFLRKYELIGIYYDEKDTGKKSVTIRYTFGSLERTLTSSEVSDAVEMYRGCMAPLGAVVAG